MTNPVQHPYKISSSTHLYQSHSSPYIIPTRKHPSDYLSGKSRLIYQRLTELETKYRKDAYTSVKCKKRAQMEENLYPLFLESQEIRKVDVDDYKVIEYKIFNIAGIIINKMKTDIENRIDTVNFLRTQGPSRAELMKEFSFQEKRVNRIIPIAERMFPLNDNIFWGGCSKEDFRVLKDSLSILKDRIPGNIFVRILKSLVGLIVGSCLECTCCASDKNSYTKIGIDDRIPPSSEQLDRRRALTSSYYTSTSTFRAMNYTISHIH